MRRDRSKERALTSMDYKKYDFKSSTKNYDVILNKGLNEGVVQEISKIKKEPKWMLDYRLNALEVFHKLKMPKWGADLSKINFNEIIYYMKPGAKNEKNWADVPDDIKKTFEKLGIPKAERKFLGGVETQFDSEVVYHSIRKDLEKQGVIFLGMDQGLKEFEDIVKEHFGTVVPTLDNKFAALNSAVWSGGSFLYVPKNVKVEMPLQAYFRINGQNMGQFERTLIVVDKGAEAHYIEGCTAPVYSTNSLHAAVVEVIAKEGANVKYTTIQNWSNNIYNLVTKRAHAHKNSTVEWIDGNLGCLAEGSTVTTPEGIKTIESLEIGDKVLSFDEHSGNLCFQPVVAKRFSGDQRVHKVSVGERSLLATSNHPFYSYTYNSDAPKKLGRYQLGYVRADKLEKLIIPRTSIDYGKPHNLKAPNLVTEFSSMNRYATSLVMTRQRQSKMNNADYTTNDIMWLFGYWVGNGDIEIKQGKTEGVVSFAKVGFSTPRENRARPKLMQTMTSLIEIEPAERKDGIHLAWNSKELAEFFHINEFEGKAKDKRVPTWVWSLPESQRLAFIAGYLDADGHSKGRGFSIKSVNLSLLEDIASLLVTLGITSRLHTEFDEPKTVTIMGVKCTAHGAYRLDFNADKRFFDFISPPFREKAQNQPERNRQTKRAVGRSNIQLSTDLEIVNVNVSDLSLEKLPTWDIEVGGTGNFVSQGFIVHNSKITMKYPSIYLLGEGSKAEILSVALAAKEQHLDAGAKAVHLASNTTSTITNKSISKDGGRSSYRGLLKVARGCRNVKSNVVCDALLLDKNSRSDTYPTIEIDEPTATISHEARVGKIGQEQIFYLMSRGISEQEALTLIVMGFISPFTKSLPMEYAIELNRLIEMEMEGCVG